MSEPRPHNEPTGGDQEERILHHLSTLTDYVRRRMGAGLRSRESVSDIVQSTAREALRGAPIPPVNREDQDDRAFARWLLRTAENKLRNRARHWRLREREGDDADDATQRASDSRAPRASAEASLAEERERLARAIDELSAEYRAVLLQVHMQGRSYAEVAADMQRSPEAVRKLFTRALARLTSLLAPG